MADQKKRQRSDQDSDYDGAWKDSLQTRLCDCMEVFFPAMHREVDWSRDAEWLDKELSQVIGKAGRRNRHVDVLAKLWLRSGEEFWVLLHLEIQTAREDSFEFRLSRYNAGIKWLFSRPVVTLAILADLDPNWHPDEYEFRLGGFEDRQRFAPCKLIDKLENEWREATSLPVQLARAQIAALRTASDPEGRYNAKWQLVRNLYQCGFTADELRDAFRLIDWMMHLRDDLAILFKRELFEFEETLEMPYVTSIERLAREEGLQEGLREGKQEAVLLLLSDICGPLPGEIQMQIDGLSDEQLDTLLRDSRRFQSVDDLHLWLVE